MRAMWPAAALLVCVSGGGGAAQMVENAFREFGLLGTWAADCGKPASRANLHSVYAVWTGGNVTLTYDQGPGLPTRYRILNARPRGDGRLFYLEENMRDQRRLEIVIQSEGSRIRVWSSRRTTGEVLVTDGKFGDGVASPWQSRCR